MYRPSFNERNRYCPPPGRRRRSGFRSRWTGVSNPFTPVPYVHRGSASGQLIVMSVNQTITPAGTLVKLGTPTRGKAIALNPNTSTNTAAVLQMGVSRLCPDLRSRQRPTYCKASRPMAIAADRFLVLPTLLMAASCSSARIAATSAWPRLILPADWRSYHLHVGQH